MMSWNFDFSHFCPRAIILPRAPSYFTQGDYIFFPQAIYTTAELSFFCGAIVLRRAIVLRQDHRSLPIYRTPPNHLFLPSHRSPPRHHIFAHKPLSIAPSPIILYRANPSLLSHFAHLYSARQSRKAIMTLDKPSFSIEPLYSIKTILLSLENSWLRKSNHALLSKERVERSLCFFDLWPGAQTACTRASMSFLPQRRNFARLLWWDLIKRKNLV